MQGVVAYRTMIGSVNGTTFYDFITVRGVLIPNMQTYNSDY